jgi:hypothetical protein
MRAPRSTLLLVLAALAACAGPTALDTEPMTLSPSEAAAVRVRVEEARRAGDFGAAWNQAVELGGERTELETIALDALEANHPSAGDMLKALVGKYERLTPAGRERVTAMSADAVRRGRVRRAVDIEIQAAEDAPTYSGAWRLYREVPPNRAEAVLSAIRDARESHAREEKERERGEGG